MAATRNDFMWADGTVIKLQEPHQSRKKEILKAHGAEIRALMGHDPWSKYVCTALVVAQLAVAYAMRDKPWWIVLTTAYLFGGVINHALELAIHELSHNLMFKNRILNRIFSLFCNLPMVVATAITFKKYHMEHHRYQGSDGVDVDIPTEFEGRWFNNRPLKLVWVFLQVLWYALRPLFVRPKTPDAWELLNWVVCLWFAYWMYTWAGIQPLVYLLICDILGLGLHPTAGHFISEHYVFTPGYETYSYYGPLNSLMFNVGYHNEHHDFPNIPGSRLHKVRAIAPEFYEDLPHYYSYCKVMYKFVMDGDMTLFNRAKRAAPKNLNDSDEL